MKLGFEQLFWVVGAILILPFIVQQGSELSRVDAPRYPVHELRSLPTAQPAVASTTNGTRVIDLSPAHNASMPDQDFQAQLDAELAELVDASVASLIIPRLQLEVPVFTAANQLTLTVGASVVPARDDLHAASRIGMASYEEGAFRNLKHLEVGDILLLRTQQRLRQFRVTASRVVDSASFPSSQSAQTKLGSSAMTLTSFSPEGDSNEHHVVTANEIGQEHSAPETSPQGPNSGAAPSHATLRF